MLSFLFGDFIALGNYAVFYFLHFFIFLLRSLSTWVVKLTKCEKERKDYMHEKDTPELGLGEQIKSACSTAFSKAKNYLLGAIPSVALYVKVDGKLVADKALHTHLQNLEAGAKATSQIEMRVEVYGSGVS